MPAGLTPIQYRKFLILQGKFVAYPLVNPQECCIFSKISVPLASNPQGQAFVVDDLGQLTA